MRSIFPVRVKRRGKSSPLHWEQWRHGKPHQEQDQIGGRLRAARPSLRVRSLKVLSNQGLREMIITSVRVTGWKNRIRLTSYLVRIKIECGHCPYNQTIYPPLT